MKNKDIIFYLLREKERYCYQKCNQDNTPCDQCKNPVVEAYSEAIGAIEGRIEE